MAKTDITFEIVETIGVLKENKSGFSFWSIGVCSVYQKSFS